MAGTQNTGTNMEDIFGRGGYYVETVGQVDEDAAKKYIEEQEECSRIEG